MTYIKIMFQNFHRETEESKERPARDIQSFVRSLARYHLNMNPMCHQNQVQKIYMAAINIMFSPGSGI